MNNINRFIQGFQQQVAPSTYENIVKFILTFARFENAICRLGWLNSNRNANWDDYATSIDASFQSNVNPQIQAACNYLLTQPPKRVNYRADGSSYPTLLNFNLPGRQATTDAKKIVRCLEQIRHNLFHGSKYPFLVRDEELVGHSLPILDYLLTISTEEFKIKFWHGMSRPSQAAAS